MTRLHRLLSSPRQRVRRSLMARVTLSFFFFAFLIVLILTATSDAFLFSGTTARHLGLLETLAAVKADALRRWIWEQRNRVEGIGHLFEVRDAVAALCALEATQSDRAEARDRLLDFSVQMLRYFGDLRNLTIIEARGGRAVFSTAAAREGLPYGQEDFFKIGKIATFMQNTRPSMITLLPTMTMATPVHDRRGVLVAVLAVDLVFDGMDEVVRSRVGLGRTGEAYLVDRSRLLLSAPRFGQDVDPGGVHSTAVDNVVRGIDGSGSYTNHKGLPVIGAYRWIAECELGLLVEIPRREVVADAITQTVMLAALGLLLSLLMAAGTYILSRRMTRPILAVQKAATLFARGDYDARAPVQTGDEIGVMAESFNTMTETVKGLLEEQKSREEHFRALLESSMDIVFVIDAEEKFAFCSPSMEGFAGKTVAELAGRGLFDGVHPEDAERLRGEIALLRGCGDAEIRSVQFRASLKGGAWRYLEARMRNLLAHPAIAGIIVNARDVTEQRQLEEKLALAQKMEALGRLAGGVAHDFNNLLTVVIGYCEALESQEQLSGESRAFVAEIQGAAERAASLTHQLLAYSRKQLLQPRPVNLNALLGDMQGMLRRLLGEDITLASRPAAALMNVKVDSHQMEQVVMNLAVNARDAMPRGGTLTFETRNITFGEEDSRFNPETAPGSYVLLAVSDTGSGMDAETQRYIFEPFFTTKEKGKGTGLGLATVYGIVKQSGGQVSVYSEPGRGSTFKILLPSCAAEEAPRQETRPERGVPAGGGIILVVEDEDPLRGMIEMVLTRAGYTVHVAESPAAAVAGLSALPRVDLLVTDVIMPGMNGKVLAESIRASRPDVKVLYISGYTESVLGEHGVLPERINFLPKPFAASALSRAVRDLLDR